MNRFNGHVPVFHRCCRRAAAPACATAMFAAVILAVSQPAAAQRAEPLMLAEAERLALAAEPGVESLMSGALAFDAHSVVAGELPEPSLRIGLNNFPVESGGFSTEAMTNMALAVRQEFPPGSERRASERRFAALADKERQAAEARRRDVLSAVRRHWLELNYWQRTHAHVAESRPFFADLLDITRSLYSVGRRSQQDVLRAELELARLDDRLIDVERRSAAARAALRQWIGADADRPLVERLPDWGAVPPVETLKQDLASHPALEAADAEIAAREAGVAVADARSSPRWAIDLGYSYREGELPSGLPRSDFISLNVTVGLPFLRRRAVDSALSAALAEQRTAESDRQRLYRELVRRVDSVYAQWQDLSRRLSLYDTRILTQTREHADAALLAYQSDRADFADVMRAYIDDLNTRIDYVRLETERAQSFAELANLGGFEQ